MTRLSKTLAMSALLAAATGVATLGMTGPAMADGTAPCNDGAGTDSTECGTSSDTGTADFATAVGFFATATGDESTAVGESSEASGNQTVAVGSFSDAGADEATAVGFDAEALAAGSTAIGRGSSASAENSVALGAFSVADRDNTVSVGDVGFERQITNVAAGTEDTDAVNVAQLNAARAALQAQLSDVQGQLNTVFDDIERINEGVALSLAMESPALPDGANFALSGGIGYFNESTAGAAAFTARIAPKASFSAGVGLGFDTNEVGARAGVQVAW